MGGSAEATASGAGAGAGAGSEAGAGTGADGVAGAAPGASIASVAFEATETSLELPSASAMVTGLPDFAGEAAIGADDAAFDAVDESPEAVVDTATGLAGVVDETTAAVELTDGDFEGGEVVVTAAAAGLCGLIA